MDNNWLNDGGGETWNWNWTEFCGYHGGIEPLNPDTHELDLCFQQLCLQIPVLVCIAIISAYHCGKRNTSLSRHYRSNSVINIRVLITVCLAVLPVIKAYIILTNTTLLPPSDGPANSIAMRSDALLNNADMSLGIPNLINHIQDGLNYTINSGKSLVSPEVQNINEPTFVPSTQSDKPVLLMLGNKVTSAKPIDYLVAGVEGLAWVVHLCFILSLRHARNTNPRGPVLVRALMFLLTVISVLLLRTHVRNKPQDEVLPNLSLGFSISVVTLLILYAITLIPGHSSLQDMRTSRFNEVSHCKLFASKILVYSIITNQCSPYGYQ